MNIESGSESPNDPTVNIQQVDHGSVSGGIDLSQIALETNERQFANLLTVLRDSFNTSLVAVDDATSRAVNAATGAQVEAQNNLSGTIADQAQLIQGTLKKAMIFGVAAFVGYKGLKHYKVI